MTKTDVEAIRNRIERIKAELALIPDMRPGNLSRQYKDPANQRWPYYQLSYTRDMKSRTDYVPRAYLPELRQEIKNYKRFKDLTDEWVTLSIEHSRLMMKAASRRK